jgi:hypothetical protein
MMPWSMMPRLIPVDMTRMRAVRLLEGGVMRAVMSAEALRAALNIMLDGMRYW